MSVCPEHERVHAYSQGKISGDHVDAIAQHVDSCPHCQATLQTSAVGDDTLVAALRSAAAKPKLCNEPELTEAIRTVQAATVADLTQNLSTSEARTMAKDDRSRVSQTDAAKKPAARVLEATQKGGTLGPSSATGAPAASPIVPATPEQFLKALESIGLLSSDELATFRSEHLSGASPPTVAALAQVLVDAGKLTRFQASHLVAGKAKALVFGEYLVIDKIGAGGMGQVFKARHRRMKRLVAIKVLPPAAVKTPDAVKRFQREVEAAAKLVHPNIVIAHDAGESNGLHFLVMELVEGQDLSSQVKERGPLPVDVAIDYIRQAACGLAFAHSEGVVHRDIKPANLLLDKKGVVKILDMGLARFDDGNAAQAMNEGLTQSGQVMGTVDYMAPEQAFDTRYADARADIYSLGCSLYRLLAGEAIYGGETMMQKFLAHREAPIPDLCARRAEVPAALQAVFARMVAKKPEERYATMTEVVAALDGVRAGASASYFNEPRSLASGSEPSEATMAWQNAPYTALPGAEATMAHIAPEIQTDPKSVLIVRRGQRAVGSQKGPPRKNRNLLIAAGAAGFFALLLGVIVYVYNHKGEKVAEIKTDGTELVPVSVPPGGSVAVKAQSGTPQATGANNALLPSGEGGRRPDESAVAASTSPHPNPLPKGEGAGGAANYELDLSAVVDDKTFAHVELPRRHPDDPVTVEMFIRSRNRRPINQALFCFQTFSNRISMKQYSGRIWWLGAGGGGKDNQVAFTPTETDQRLHVAGVMADNALQLYVDGRLAGTSSLTTKPAKTFEICNLGAMAPAPKDNTWAPFDGTIDEVRISDGARYDKDFTPQERLEPDAQTWALYHCDEGSGDVLVDASGRGNHGKVIGATWVRSGSGQAPTHQSLAPSEILTSPDWAWSEPERLDVLGPRGNAAISGDELSLASAGDGKGGFGGQDIWIQERTSVDEPFGPPVNAGAEVNTAAAEQNPWLSSDGLTLVFNSKRGGSPTADLWAATRPARGQPFEPAKVLGPAVNTRESSEYFAAMPADRLSIIFTSGRSGGLGGVDFWQCRRTDPHSPFEHPVNLGPGVNSPLPEGRPALSADGRVMVFQVLEFAEDDAGGPTKIRGASELWIAERASLDAPFGPRVKLAAPINLPGAINASPSLTADGKQLYFMSQRGGDASQKLYVSRRVPRPAVPLTQTEILTSPDWAWSEPENLGPTINTPQFDAFPAISGDGLTLIFETNRSGLLGEGDLWIAERASIDAPFTAPANLGPTVNSPEREMSPWLSGDGLTLVFNSNRNKSTDQVNQFMATRTARGEPFRAAVPLPGVKAKGWAWNVAMSADGLRLISSDGAALFEATRQDAQGTFGARKSLSVNSGAVEFCPWLSADDRVLLFNRRPATTAPGSQVNAEIWMAARPTVDEPFAVPTLVGPPISFVDANDEHPSVTADGKLLFFSSNRPGGQGLGDIWFSRRVPRDSGPRAVGNGQPPLDALRREDIAANDLQSAGLGDPAKAPAELVRVATWFAQTDRRQWTARPLVSAFSPDGSMMAWSGGSTTRINLRSLLHKNPGITSEDLGHALNVLVFSPDGSLLAVGQNNGPIVLVDAATGSIRSRLKGHTNGILSLAFSPDGRTLASGAGQPDSTARLWDVASGRELAVLKGHTSGVRVAFSPDGQGVLTAATDNLLKRWDVATGRELASLTTNTLGNVGRIEITPNGTTLVAGFPNIVKILDPATGAQLGSIKREGINDFAIRPDGRSVALSQDNGAVTFVEIPTGKEIGSLQLGPPDGVISKIAYDATGRYLLTFNGNGTAYVLRLTSRDREGADAAPLTDVRGSSRATHWQTPEFEAWVKATQALPAEQQVEAVAKKLMELNPGFDGKVTGVDENGMPKIEKGVVTQFRFIVTDVTDISPVRAMAGLKVLRCVGGGSSGRGKLTDLSPLAEMSLTTLNFHHTQVSDLSPLAYMLTLGSLDVRGTKVTPTSIAALQKALPNCKIEWDGAAKTTSE
ncbi:MAG TPA: protein kinase [Pirellulales bacterium]|jgi:serine/threonine protein kinase/WD40 repeat protein|nr:protein kinase [Pirellulales bacterium]